MPLLDELSGFEFEDLMEDVFRKLGYGNVRQSTKTGDEGRDILMEEPRDDGPNVGVVVECKHTRSVGRPVVQKLHSAVATYDYDGPVRGIVVTTGRFTAPAREYAESLRENSNPPYVDLIDGDDLREIGDQIGLDLYNGKIEILCDETLLPYDPSRGPHAPVRDQFETIENFDPSELPEPKTVANFVPALAMVAHTDSVFETSVGVVNRIDRRDHVIVDASRGGAKIADEPLQSLVRDNLSRTTEFDEDRFERTFDVVASERFGETETDYKDWLVDRLQKRNTETVRYTGDNNVTYTKTCEPNQSDIRIEAVNPVYVPQIRATTSIRGYDYPYEYWAAGATTKSSDDGIHRCVQCETERSGTYTFCDNCGSINCPSHTKTERLEGEPVCTGCAVTESFVLSTKYFYDEENLEEFRAEYREMPIYRKVWENRWLAVGGGIAGVLLAVFLLIALVGGAGILLG